jgi:hypothetical protein
MAYGNDVTVYVEDRAGDLGAPGSPVPWWLSPDVDLPGHPGLAVQGANDVGIRVHAHDEPVLEDKIVAEVYVCAPSLTMSPGTSKRIDPGNLLFRPANVAGSEPVADDTGGTLTFSWTPSSAVTEPDGPGHRCLVLRAFPQGVTPPSSPFDVPNEQHEAQHNIEVLTTAMKKSRQKMAGAGTPKDPRRRDAATERWWEDLITLGVGRRGRRFVVWAFDPSPSDQILRVLKRAKVRGLAEEPPGNVAIDVVEARGEQVDVDQAMRRRFARKAGLGSGLFAQKRLLAAATLEVGPRKPAHVQLGFDHSNLAAGTAVVLHGAQWDESGRAEGGMTIAALAPR